MSTSPLVAFDGVGFVASGRTILRDLSFEVSPGDVLGVVGPNGSGKTTLIRLLSTLQRPTDGEWMVLGADSGSRPRDLVRARKRIAMIGHTPAVWPELTLAENLELVAALSPGDDLDDPLTAVGLSDAADRPAGLASVGMQRRLEFARILGRLPDLLLLDEAHGGLDSDAVRIVDESIRRVISRGGAVVLVSHHDTHLDGLATRRAMIERGRFIEGAS